MSACLVYVTAKLAQVNGPSQYSVDYIEALSTDQHTESYKQYSYPRAFMILKLLIIQMIVSLLIMPQVGSKKYSNDEH